MRPRNWNYGPHTPLAPVTVYEAGERTAHSGLFHPNGEEIVWVLDEPVIGFVSPSERGHYENGAVDTSQPINDYTVSEVPRA